MLKGMDIDTTYYQYLHLWQGTMPVH